MPPNVAPFVAVGLPCPSMVPLYCATRSLLVIPVKVQLSASKYPVKEA